MTSQGEYSFEICSAGCCVLLEVLAYVRVQNESRERGNCSSTVGRAAFEAGTSPSQSVCRKGTAAQSSLKVTGGRSAWRGRVGLRKT